MEICGVVRDVPEGVRWEVGFPSPEKYFVQSPNFTCGNIKCALSLYNIIGDPNFARVNFAILYVPGDANLSRLIRWQLDIVGGDGTRLSCIANGQKAVTGGYQGLAQNVVLRPFELRRLAPRGARLTFVLRLKVEGVDTDMRFPTEHPADKTHVSSEAPTEDDSDAATAKEGSNADLRALLTLRKHFKDLLLSGDDHDVVIKIHNREFKAHRSVLRARSPVFAAMFRSEMKESTDGTVTIDDCDPDAFGDFLEYVYTGKVQNMTAGNAMGLYYAGDKYDFPGLKEACVEFLKTSLSTTTVSGVVSLAAKHGEQDLLESAVAFFSEHIEEIMVTVEWQRFLLANPIQANEICLKAVKFRSHRN